MALEPLERLGESLALDAPAQRKRMLVIVNPCASTVSDRLRHLVVAALQGRYDVDAVDTQARGHATELCREAAGEGYDVVTSFGGDGTVNEAANGLAGSDTPLTCLPGGATNVLCKMLGIPADIVDATEHLLLMADAWQPRRIDLGVVNGRCYTFSSGYGIDASVVKRIDRNAGLKRARLREYYFAYAAVETVLRHYVVRPPRIDVHVGGRTIRGITVVVQNGNPFTYFDATPLHVAEGTSLDSGTLAGAVLRGVRVVDIPTVMYRLFSKRSRVTDHKQVAGFSDATQLRCVAVDGTTISLQADGEHIGDVAEAVYAIRPGALTVVS